VIAKIEFRENLFSDCFDWPGVELKFALGHFAMGGLPMLFQSELKLVSTFFEMKKGRSEDLPLMIRC
jgi:hypothetical protein